MDEVFLTSYYIINYNGYKLIAKSTLMDKADLQDVCLTEYYLDFDGNEATDSATMSFEEAIGTIDEVLSDNDYEEIEIELKVGNENLESWKRIEKYWRENWDLEGSITEAVESLDLNLDYPELLWLMEELHQGKFDLKKYISS